MKRWKFQITSLILKSRRRKKGKMEMVGLMRIQMTVGEIMMMKTDGVTTTMILEVSKFLASPRNNQP